MDEETKALLAASCLVAETWRAEATALEEQLGSAEQAAASLATELDGERKVYSAHMRQLLGRLGIIPRQFFSGSGYLADDQRALMQQAIDKAVCDLQQEVVELKRQAARLAELETILPGINQENADLKREVERLSHLEMIGRNGDPGAPR